MIVSQTGGRLLTCWLSTLESSVEARTSCTIEFLANEGHLSFEISLSVIENRLPPIVSQSCAAFHRCLACGQCRFRENTRFGSAQHLDEEILKKAHLCMWEMKYSRAMRLGYQCSHFRLTLLFHYFVSASTNSWADCRFVSFP